MNYFLYWSFSDPDQPFSLKHLHEIYNFIVLWRDTFAFVLHIPIVQSITVNWSRSCSRRMSSIHMAFVFIKQSLVVTKSSLELFNGRWRHVFNLVFRNKIISFPPFHVIGSIIVGVTLSKVCRVLMIVNDLVSLSIDLIHSKAWIVAAHWGNSWSLEDGSNRFWCRWIC